VDVTLDAEGRCYVSDDRRGAVFRIDDGESVPVADGLGAPQGLAARGGELFTVDTVGRRLWSVSLTTGVTRVEAEGLAVGIPPGTTPRPAPALFTHGLPGVAPGFAGLTTAPDGSLLLSSNGEGTVVRLSPARTGT
jgi:sugar lactone lactonase YvrE